MTDVARRAGVHVATVSRALNRQSGVSRAVRAQVIAIAEEMGYRINPLVAALIRSRRNPHRAKYHATLGILEPAWPPGAAVFRQDYRQLIEGARTSAAALGYTLEFFRAEEPGVSRRRLTQIFETRSIAGLLVPPLFSARELLGLDRLDRPVMAVGYSQKIAVPRVTHDHTHGMRLAIDHCRAAGYRRLGLVLPRRVSEKVEDRWLAAFLARQFAETESELLPPLVLDDTGATLALERWCRRWRPEVILGLQHMTPLRGWSPLSARGHAPMARVNLDRREQGEPWAGINQRKALLGSVAIEQLVHLIERNDPAIATRATKMMIEGEWVGGEGF